MFKPNYAADILYPTIRNRGRRSLVWSFLTQRSRYLHALREVEATGNISARHNGGVQTVKISQIRGSRGRSTDFDRDFNVLQSHIKDRWLHVAEARQSGTALPVIDLIQVGDIYFVSDGHHRISVARAFGQREMEARVTVWQVNGELRWDASGDGLSIANLNSNIKRLSERIRSQGHDLKTRLVLNISDLLIAVGTKLKSGYQLETASAYHNDQ